MSMNLFFRGFTQQQIDKMKEELSLIDQLVKNGEYLLETDIETAWDVLGNILNGEGIGISERIDEALYNGCNLISSEEVKKESLKLSKWKHEEILEKLRALDEESDLYHLEIYQDEEEYLLEQFDKLVNFYQTAARQNLVILSYLA
jgi:hypothetical protein